MKKVFLFVALLLAAADAHAQQALLQGGSKTAGHLPMYQQSGTGQPIVLDAGPAGGNTTGQGISELNQTNRTTTGTGPNGEHTCLQSAVSTAASGYSLCLDASQSSKGIISYQAFGSASAQDLIFKINGTSYTFPFTSGAVIGPGSSVVNDVACWNNTAGTLLKDCGAFPSVGGTANQIQYNAAGSFGGFTMSGDCTIIVATGAITCPKISGVSVSLGGALTTASTLTTAGVFPLTLTTTASTNVTLPLTGTLSTLAGAEAFTNKTYNGNTWTAGTGTLTIAAAKTLTAPNTLTLTATDGSTLAIGTGGTLGTAAYTASTAYMPSGTQITNSLGGDVALNNTSNYFDGPSVAQGSIGTWFCSGTVTLGDTTGGATFAAKLWDGTTVIASAQIAQAGASAVAQAVALSGYLATPAGNIRISAKDSTNTAGVIKSNSTGNSKDSTVSCFRTQ